MPPSPVQVRREPLLLPTYEPLPPDKNPMFLERRVYQGSSGRVYPLPFFNRVAEQPRRRAWEAVTIENEFIRVVVLPELGGRIFVGQDKTNGYDFFYRQSVIKPALVGLAGPWISGGVEFNWPQHHRPATYLPVEVAVEEHADGARTVWLGDHDPMERMKGMHGVCLRPGEAAIELKMRAYNRTTQVQTFLWWANVATHVHEAYQSFFPPDVTTVADHARRAMSRFPLCDGSYYGVDYAARARQGVPAAERPSRFVPPHHRPAGRVAGVPDYAPNDLSWYANIPVPTSYMAVGSREDFSGGYDHFRQAGLVQVANHHIAPGKKQWTWGNHAFGYAWDRNLTDADGPYIELMLGVYTDNQPDFSFLQPGETKTWSVHWYPIQQIGPVQAANAEAALSLARHGPDVRLGVAVTRVRRVRVELRHGRKLLRAWAGQLRPDRPLAAGLRAPARVPLTALEVRVRAEDGRELLRYQPAPPARTELPAPASEPPAPSAVAGADELYVIGLHLAQYRHATRSPVPYWTEALRRDPGDSRCLTALGTWHLRRGEWEHAEARLRAAIARLTSRNANPYDGEAFYQLGCLLRMRGRDTEAYDAFYKAVWNQAWQAAGYHALAEIDAAQRNWEAALDHLDRALRLNADNLRARNLQVMTLRALGRMTEAADQLAATRRLDPLDVWSRWLAGEALGCDTQTKIDLALDLFRAGFTPDAIAVLEEARQRPAAGTAPLVSYHLAALHDQLGQRGKVRAALRRAAGASPDYCFPARLEEIGVLERALALQPGDARAAYYLGNLLYDRRRHEEAIACWERSARLDPGFATVWRNLGIGWFNVRRDPVRARRAYDRALAADPGDARLLYERDQLWKRLGVAPARRLRALERRRDLVDQRDDATIEYGSLLLQLGRVDAAAGIVAARRFQPWEGGEGQALGLYVRTRLALARRARAGGNPTEAVVQAEAALHPPGNLGEARHLLANCSDVWFELGEARAAAGDAAGARAAWTQAAAARGDFQEMSVRRYSEMTCFSALALRRLGRGREARTLLDQLDRHGRELGRTPARIDYFATSLPTMLLFEDDLTAGQQTTGRLLRAQAAWGRGRRAEARRGLAAVLRRDPSHGLAADLLAELDRPTGG